MGSKRSKKPKQELELFAEKPNMKIKEENETLLPQIGDVAIDNNTVIPTSTVVPKPKAPKRKKKNEGAEEVPKKVKKTNETDSDVKKVKVRKKRTKSNENIGENKQLPMNGESVIQHTQKNNKSPSPDKKKDEITWPDNDIVELMNRMEGNIPEKDVLAYRSRVEKLNWASVAFKNYTGEECKKTWLQVQKRIRRFRLLREVLNDAKEWIRTPRTNHKLPRPRKHPDMPRRPLSSYLLFYLKKKDEIISENPGLEGSDVTKMVGQIYKNLPPEIRETYEKQAASNREEYLEKLKIFFETHPEFVPPPKLNLNLNHKSITPIKVEKDKLPMPEKMPIKIEKEKPIKVEKEKAPKVEKAKVPKIPKVDKDKPSKAVKHKPKADRRGRPPKIKNSVDRPPKKCQTPFGLYFASQLKTMEAGADKSAFKENCKQQYRQMPDTKKMSWISLAEEDLKRYEEEVKAYKAKYPDYKILKIRSILTKREKASKERASGKPVKPPNSAYALYSRVMLQTQSDEIKTVHPKDRMNYIAGKWKNCPEEEQNLYRDQVISLMEQYKQEYQAYVDTLPEEEKRKILQLTRRKRGRSGRASGRIRKPRKRKPTKSAKKVPPVKTKFTEPEQPPISACKYFATQYKGEGDPVQAWKALAAEEKRKYEEELVKKKQAYIVEFEKFLKSLSKEELEAFSKSRQQQVQSDDGESSECSSASEGEADEADEEDEEGEGEAGEHHNDENADEVHNNGNDAHESDSE